MGGPPAGGQPMAGPPAGAGGPPASGHAPQDDLAAALMGADDGDDGFPPDPLASPAPTAPAPAAEPAGVAGGPAPPAGISGGPAPPPGVAAPRSDAENLLDDLN